MLNEAQSSVKLSEWVELQEQNRREEVCRQGFRSLFLGGKKRTDQRSRRPRRLLCLRNWKKGDSQTEEGTYSWGKRLTIKIEKDKHCDQTWQDGGQRLGGIKHTGRC